MKIELYIDRQLCDISDPEKFSVYLKRQLYNPAELNTKDAQASYTITLPASTTNNRIFGFANVEEVRGKFERLYDAELIVNGIRIFEGKFKLSEIDSFSYKGNLGIPAPKTVKDIFGDRNMNELEEWTLATTGLKDPQTGEELKGLDYISYYNKQENPDCIFPFALYGLMPRLLDIETDADKNINNETTPEEKKYIEEYQQKYKTIIDQSVRFGLADFPASINCLRMLEVIFSNAGYKLTGSAFSDERLKKLYVSYKNPNDYVQEWNWGDLAKMRIDASWATHKATEKKQFDELEKQIIKSEDDYGHYYAVNLFNSNNLNIKEISDGGTNIIYKQVSDKYTVNNKEEKYTRNNLNLMIPKSGYYKVKLRCNNFELAARFTQGEWGTTVPRTNIRFKDPVSNIMFTSVFQDPDPIFLDLYNNAFERKRYELQLLRDYGEGDFRLSNIVGLYNRPQFAQTEKGDEDQYPKYYPVPGGPMVVDPCINQNFICGLRWGQSYIGKDQNYYEDKNDPNGNYMFIANGFSWDKSFSQKKKILCAYDSSIYNESNSRRTDGNYLYFGFADDETQENAKPSYNENRYTKVRYAHFNENPDFSIDEDGKPLNRNYVRRLPEESRAVHYKGDGYVECVVWLEKGESLTVALVGDMGDTTSISSGLGKLSLRVKRHEAAVLIDNLNFTLEVEPFRTDIEWCNFDSQGNYNPLKILSWNDDKDPQDPNKNHPYAFRKGNINLTEFLPSGQKMNDWLEHFCKAFNLSLIQKEDGNFELNARQTVIINSTSRLIDLDKRAHKVNRSNTPLGLPRKYKLGFTINTDEQGYRESMEDEKNINSGNTGGGEYPTGSFETDDIQQTSNFSYCWYKQLYKPEEKEGKKKIVPAVQVPVISDQEVWKLEGKGDYKDMMSKTYFDKAQRFWYRSGQYYTLRLGSDFKKNEENPVPDLKGKEVQIALTSNHLGENTVILDYEDKPGSIMRNFFFLLHNINHYTEIECFLTPEEYKDIDSCLVKFNGDLYNVMAVDGYDPACRKPAKVKLIPKIS